MHIYSQGIYNKHVSYRVIVFEGWSWNGLLKVWEDSGAEATLLLATLQILESTDWGPWQLHPSAVTMDYLKGETPPDFYLFFFKQWFKQQLPGCNPSIKEIQTDGPLGLTSQPTWRTLSSKSVRNTLSKSRWTAPKEQHPTLSSGLHVCTCLYTHVCIL